MGLSFIFRKIMGLDAYFTPPHPPYKPIRKAASLANRLGQPVRSGIIRAEAPIDRPTRRGPNPPGQGRRTV